MSIDSAAERLLEDLAAVGDSKEGALAVVNAALAEADAPDVERLAKAIRHYLGEDASLRAGHIAAEYNRLRAECVQEDR